MIEVKPVQTKEEQEALCAKADIPYDADLLMYAAHLQGEIVGVCQFGMPQKVGCIVHLAATKERSVAVDEALFIMGRAALNFIDLCGVHEAYISTPAPEDEALVRKIGFSQTPSGWYMNLEGFFASPCSHH